jgi:hypothetical protein
VVAAVVGAVVVVVVAVVLATRDDKRASAPPTTAGSSSTRPVTRPTGHASTSTAPPTTIASVPTITLPPPFSSAQLESALLQNGDLPTDSSRAIVSPRAWGGVCGSSGPAVGAPFSAAAVDFNGPQELHVREDLANYLGDSGAYLEAVRQKITCGTYVPDGQPGTTVTVVPVASDVVNGTLDTHSGSEGVAVQTLDKTTGRRSFHVWVRHGTLVISVQDDARTATPTSAVQLAQLAVQRIESAL